MSSTIKQAILSLKSRIADSYTAIQTKGGTLPATQDSASLPAAIASIQSGGVDANILQLSRHQYMNISEIIDADGVITSVDCNALQNCSTLKKIYLPNCTYIATGAFNTTPALEELYLPRVITISSNSVNAAFWHSKIVHLNLPLCSDLMYYAFYNCYSMIEAYIPQCYASYDTNYAPFEGCGKLIKIVTGYNFTGNCTLLAKWTPSEALLESSSSLVDEGESFVSNREKLLYNIRNYIAANMPSGNYTIRFSGNVKASILADQPTADAFTNKGWTIA